jgi:translation initiation factor 1
MSKNNKPGEGGFVFSTNPDFRVDSDEPSLVTLSPAEQRLKISLQTKHRAGKTVTVIAGFEGKSEDAEALGKQLRNYCGTGGAVKESEIILQGDHREKAFQFLSQKGYSSTKRN